MDLQTGTGWGIVSGSEKYSIFWSEWEWGCENSTGCTSKIRLYLSYISIFQKWKKIIFPYRNIGHKTDHLKSITCLNNLFQNARKCLTFLGEKKNVLEICNTITFDLPQRNWVNYSVRSDPYRDTSLLSWCVYLSLEQSFGSSSTKIIKKKKSMCMTVHVYN